MATAKDAITILKQDHRDLRSMFAEYADMGERARKAKEHVRDRIVKALSVHAAIEERVFYPLVIQKVPDIEESILEGMTEHALAEQLLAEIAGMDVDDRWFRPKMMILGDLVRHHMREEEAEVFPAMRETLDRAELIDLGATLLEERKVAPTAPPPSAQARAAIESVADRAQSFVHTITAPLRSAS
jgi:hemerythrin-like domain-containing protein